MNNDPSIENEVLQAGAKSFIEKLFIIEEIVSKISQFS